MMTGRYFAGQGISSALMKYINLRHDDDEIYIQLVNAEIVLGEEYGKLQHELNMVVARAFR